MHEKKCAWLFCLRYRQAQTRLKVSKKLSFRPDPEASGEVEKSVICN